MTVSIWSDERVPRKGAPPITPAAETGPGVEHRSPFQKDYDRLLFSTPVRRLSDKTQVWPMDDNDGVRSRNRALRLWQSHCAAVSKRRFNKEAHLRFPHAADNRY
jgi:hypothetical protein